MFSKEEAAKIRKEFWISFGKSFPRKWLLYNTKIKGFHFKFVAERKHAMVCLDIDHPDAIANELLFDQVMALKTLLINDFLPEVHIDEQYVLDSGKVIKRLYVPFPNKFSIYNKATWQPCFEFFVSQMSRFELFFEEYQDFIKQAL